MAKFNGQLKSNEIFGALYNMIISQQVFSDNIQTTSSLVGKARVDGGLHGDTKLFYATDALASSEWGNDAEAANLLKLYRPKAPECQAITLDKFRQIAVTFDNYLSKRAWGTEGAFSEFQNVMKGWIADTKQIYDETTYNCFIGTDESTKGKQQLSVNVTEATAGLTGNEKKHAEAEAIAEAVANLITDMGDVSRDYNDYGFIRKYAAANIKMIWNADVYNHIRKVDLPTMFHKEGLIDKFDEDKINARYFGKKNVGSKKGDGATVRSLVEQLGPTSHKHYFPGDIIDSTDTMENTYTEDKTIIGKVYVKLPPFMSAFEVGTSFFNPKSLTETNYLTWGHNTLEHLEGYPVITIRSK